MPITDKEVKEPLEETRETDHKEKQINVTPILEEITIEELAVDGICGIY